MKKELQKEINQKVEQFIDKFNSDNTMFCFDEKRLRSCQAKVYCYNNYYILQSYGTLVAGIDRKTGEAYDFLRFVYGYTATSAQHIHKFFADYGWGKFYPDTVYTWRDC